MNFHIGQRVRRNCENCTKIFHTQKIDAAGNEKNRYCRECKYMMKIVRCYCGNDMYDHDLVDGQWIANQFCSKKCKVRYS